MPPIEQDKDDHLTFSDKDTTEVNMEAQEEDEAAEEVAPLAPAEPHVSHPDVNGDCEKYDTEEAKARHPMMEKRRGRFSTTSAPGFPSRGSFFSQSRGSFFSSRPSFGGLGGLSSRPSMASLKSTISRVNSEMYPERGSFVAMHLGQSFANMPELARKMYIITQILAAVSVSIGSMAVGFSAGYTSPALASMDAESAGNSTSNSTSNSFNLTEEQKSWIGSLMPLSALTGSILGGYLIDALGRKMVILLCGPPFILAWLLIGSAVNVWMIYVGRAIGGLCVGLLTLTLPVYLAETIQPEIRGILGLLPTTFGNGGILVCFLVGSYVNWWWLAYVGAIIPLVFATMMCFVPETPRWYVSKDRDEDAEKSLEWLRGSEADVQFELEAIQENYQMANQESSSIRDIFTRQYIRPFALALGLMLFQQLSGINAVIFYTVDIFKMSGSAIDSQLSTIIVGVVNLMSTLVANAVIDKLGRKILLYISSAMMVVSLVSLGAYFFIKSKAEGVSKDQIDYEELLTTVENLSWLPLVSFMIYVIAFSLGWGPIPWLFMGEALPAKIRGPAASLVTAMNWSCTFIVTKTFPGLLKAIGPSSVFFMFSGIMAFGSLYSIFFIPETKGKTLEDIEAELAGRRTLRERKISTASGIYMK